MINKEHGNGKLNRLADEKSPYLLQHAGNPVDWYPWGDDAFEEAKTEDKPVFLSIGYSTCHWCHVMEKESFEDPEVAELLNRDYISIKVDREERPDLDQVYMAACQALTGQGGWPLTVIMTPDKKPFFAGTYFPKHSRYGIHGMMDLLPKIAEAWKGERNRVEEAAGELTGLLHRQAGEGSGTKAGETGALPQADVLSSAFGQLASIYDLSNGGFGGAPKFPSPHQLIFLLRMKERGFEQEVKRMTLDTLKAMHRGGIFDQIGYGMHRYSVDASWLVPHFEKMLYDQATTALAALEAYRAYGDEEVALLARRIFEYVETDLTSPEGAFYSAEDADSEGEEGTFYVWTPGQLEAVLGKERAGLAAAYFGVTAKGNFEKETSVLHRTRDINDFASSRGMEPEKLAAELETIRLLLLEHRNRRPRPFRDDKILAAWNGLYIAALAAGSQTFGEKKYAATAGKAADFILQRMVNEEGLLLRRFREGEAAIPAFLDDYAAMALALLELYSSTFDSRRLAQAAQLARKMLELFYNDDGTLRYGQVEDSAETLPLTAEAYDGAVPSAVSLAAMALLRLGRILRDQEMTAAGEKIISRHGEKLQRYPGGHTYLLAALDYALEPPEELVLTGKQGSAVFEEMAGAARSAFKPRMEIIYRPVSEEDEIFSVCPHLKELPGRKEEATAYLCRQLRCLPPVSDPFRLKAMLSEPV